MKERLHDARLLLAALGMNMFMVSLVILEVDPMNFEKSRLYSNLGWAILLIVIIWNAISYSREQ